MRIGKDILAIGGVIVLAAVAVFVTRDGKSKPTPETVTQASTEAATPQTDEIVYRIEGGPTGLRFAEVAIRGPENATVRYEPFGGSLVEKQATWTAEDHARLIDRLREVSFFEVDEVPRKKYDADFGKTVIVARVGSSWNEVLIDGRTRASVSLDSLIRLLDQVRASVTPEGVLTGD
ncbi:MAG: hypothetical protein ACYS22_00855 [Planctomycetota bacterium]